jgi:hypothetical protein
MTSMNLMSSERSYEINIRAKIPNSAITDEA